MTRALLLTLVLVAGCAKAAPPSSCPLPPKPSESLDDRRTSCDALFQHLVDLGVQGYLAEEGTRPSKKELARIRAGWEAELRENGKASAVEHMCLARMTADQIGCVSKAQSLEQVNGCFE